MTRFEYLSLKGLLLIVCAIAGLVTNPGQRKMLEQAVKDFQDEIDKENGK